MTLSIVLPSMVMQHDAGGLGLSHAMIRAEQSENHNQEEEESQEESSLHESDISRDSAALIVQWLVTNYRVTDDKKTIPRSDIYSHYEDWCLSRQHTCYNAAMFGKIFKTAFQSVSTRRIGGRLASKYHYCGLERVKEGDKNDDAALLLSQVKANFATQHKTSIFEHHNRQSTVAVAPAMNCAQIPVKIEEEKLSDVNELKMHLSELYCVIGQMKMRIDVLELAAAKSLGMPIMPEAQQPSVLISTSPAGSTPTTCAGASQPDESLRQNQPSLQQLMPQSCGVLQADQMFGMYMPSPYGWMPFAQQMMMSTPMAESDGATEKRRRVC